MMQGINNLKLGVNYLNFKGNENVVAQTPPKTTKGSSLERQPEADTFNNANAKDGVEIGMIRLATGFLTDEQVAKINETRKLPDNAKFIANGYGQYYIANNFFGVRAGTQTLPEGFEVKKNVLGRAVVIAKDTNGLLIK